MVLGSWSCSSVKLQEFSSLKPMLPSHSMMYLCWAAASVWVTVSVNHILHSCWKSHNAWAWSDADQSIVGRGNVVSAMLTCECVVAKKLKTVPLTGCDTGGGECDTLRQSQSDVTLEVESVILSDSHNQM